VKQTRLVSLIETLINTTVGFLVSFAGWPIAAAMTGIQYNNSQHITVVAFFTVLSVIRGYVIRRWFNNELHVASVKIAKKVWATLYA
tara:strand:+ start:10531 stop:10791 length:261 start_codon:yes stop_codon:yes gene_type:complete